MPSLFKILIMVIVLLTITSCGKGEIADIGSVDKLDIMAVRKDGGVDLIIVCVGRLKGTPEMQKLLMDKIENYLNYINGKDFKNKYGNISKDKVYIILSCAEKPDNLMYQLFDKIKPWVKENNATFKLEIDNK